MNVKSNFWKVFTSWRMSVVFLLGFSSGIPLGLTGGTLQAWMASEKVDLTVIGIFSLVGLPYTFKFIWSPLMDRFVPPFLGRRRGWMIVTQIGLVLTISLMAFSNPLASPGMLAAVAFLVAFFSASQDIVVDAYRTEVIEDPNELGAGASLYVTGYRLAMLVSGAIALILSDQMSWQTVYLLMAGTMVVGILATVFAPEPVIRVAPPKSLRDAVVLPFVEFFKRHGALEILAFVILFKLGEVILLAMTTPFMIQLGFTKTDIGGVNKVFGLIATLFGVLVGGAWMIKLGIKKSLWVFGILQSASHVGFMALAYVGHSYPVMVGAIAIENLCGGMGTAAYSAFLMNLCNKRFTATQYALLTSLMAVARVIAAAPTGFLAKNVGWVEYFFISSLFAIPGLLLLLRYDRWEQQALNEGVVLSA